MERMLFSLRQVILAVATISMLGALISTVNMHLIVPRIVRQTHNAYDKTLHEVGCQCDFVAFEAEQRQWRAKADKRLDRIEFLVEKK